MSNLILPDLAPQRNGMDGERRRLQRERNRAIEELDRLARALLAAGEPVHCPRCIHAPGTASTLLCGRHSDLGRRLEVARRWRANVERRYAEVMREETR